METTRRIEALLLEAEAAHGAFETNVLAGKRDEDWPAWYAAFLLDHGLIEHLPRSEPIDPAELAATLVRLNDLYQSQAPQESWPAFFAARLAAGGA